MLRSLVCARQMSIQGTGDFWLGGSVPKSVGPSASEGVLGLATERETCAVLKLRFWFAAGGCTAGPFCCTALPEVFVEVSPSVHPSPIYSFYLPLRPLWFCWFVLAGVTQRDHRAHFCCVSKFCFGIWFRIIFRYSYGEVVGITDSAGGEVYHLIWYSIFTLLIFCCYG